MNEATRNESGPKRTWHKMNRNTMKWNETRWHKLKRTGITEHKTTHTKHHSMTRRKEKWSDHMRNKPQFNKNEQQSTSEIENAPQQNVIKWKRNSSIVTMTKSNNADDNDDKTTWIEMKGDEHEKKFTQINMRINMKFNGSEMISNHMWGQTKMTGHITLQN